MAKKNTKKNDDIETGETSIGALVRRLEQNYIEGNITISKYVQFSLYENISKIDAYLNSKHTTGETDSMGREKPFFNIVVAACNIWYRATDRDRKNIRVKATKTSQILAAFIANILLQEWMRKTNFGAFLNEWGRVLSRYGSAVCKFVVKNGELIPSVEAWNTIIIDPIDFENNPKIKVLELTEAQLRKNPYYDQDLVEKLCSARANRKGLDRLQKETDNPEYVRVYEIHGELPLSHMTGDPKDDDDYVQQMHAFTYLASKEKGKFDDFDLYKGREKKEPNMITHLIKEDGRSQAIGAVEHLFDSQWMMNHTAKMIKDELDLASKLIFQTADGNFVGQNALTAIETGDILIHAENMPLTQLNNASHDITQIQNYNAMWKALSNEAAGISESMLGNTPKAGTAWRQTQAVLAENYSLFGLMRQNKDLYIEQMLREYIIPYIKTKMKNSKEIGAILSADAIDQIDAMYVPREAIKRHNKQIIDTVLGGKVATQPDLQAIQGTVQSELDQLGNQRFIKPSDIESKTWGDVINDLEWDLEVVNDESSDMDAITTTLNTTFQNLVAMQGRSMTAEERLVFNKILDATAALSPIDFANAGAKGITPAASPAAPTSTAAGPSGGPVETAVGSQIAK